MPKIKTVIFDISGVLIELGGMPDFVKWTGKSPEEIGSLWLESESAREFESGKTDFTSFHKRFQKEWSIQISNRDLKMAFQSWVREPLPGASKLVLKLHGLAQIACLSNTNEIQWPVVCESLEMDKLFPKQFASYKLGMVKPDREIFDYTLSELNASPSSTLFFDDSQLNVDAARSVGIHAVKVKGPNDINEALHEYGIFGTKAESGSEGD